jgi:hypothetical protein
MPIKLPKSAKYDFTRNLVKRHKLVGYLDRYLADEVQDFKFEYEPKVGDDAWHPSGHCTPGVTDLYQVATGNVERKEWGAAMLKTFMVGHFWHQLLQKAIVDSDLADESAIERKGVRIWEFTDPIEEIASPYHWATGAGDVAPCVIPNHGEYVVDFKTMSGLQYRANGVPDWAADKYEAQINIYMDFFDLDKALIVAVCKDSPHEMKEFEYVRNQPLIDAIYDKWHFVSECLDANTPPSSLDDDEFTLNGLFTGPIAQ